MPNLHCGHGINHSWPSKSSLQFSKYKAAKFCDGTPWFIYQTHIEWSVSILHTFIQIFMHERIWYTPISLNVRDWNIWSYNELSKQLHRKSTKWVLVRTPSFNILSIFNIVNMINISKYDNENLKCYEFS